LPGYSPYTRLSRVVIYAGRAISNL
jgi:hypothetical protein